MNKASNTGPGRGLDLPIAMTDVSEALREQSSAWFNAQIAFADATQRMMATWAKCRQEDAQAALQAFQRVVACRDGGNVAAAYNDWLTGNMDRIKVEFSDAREEGLRLAAIGQQSMRALSLNEAGRIRATGASVANPKAPAHHSQENPPLKSAPEMRKHAAAD